MSGLISERVVWVSLLVGICFASDMGQNVDTGGEAIGNLDLDNKLVAEEDLRKSRVEEEDRKRKEAMEEEDRKRKEGLDSMLAEEDAVRVKAYEAQKELETAKTAAYRTVLKQAQKQWNEDSKKSGVEGPEYVKSYRPRAQPEYELAHPTITDWETKDPTYKFPTRGPPGVDYPMPYGCVGGPCEEVSELDLGESDDFEEEQKRAPVSAAEAKGQQLESVALLKDEQLKLEALLKLQHSNDKKRLEKLARVDAKKKEVKRMKWAKLLKDNVLERKREAKELQKVVTKQAAERVAATNEEFWEQKHLGVVFSDWERGNVYTHQTATVKFQNQMKQRAHMKEIEEKKGWSIH